MKKGTTLKTTAIRLALTVVLLTAPVMTAWAQEMNKKFSISTQMFMDELQQQKRQQDAGPQRAPKRRLPDGSAQPQPSHLIASPDTIDGVAYISCFIHLSNPSDLSSVRNLGVMVQNTFDGQNFITAQVPVNQLDALANVANVTNVEVAQMMLPQTDVARQKTNVDDLLNLSPSAAALGVNSKYDGTGVVLGVIDTGIDFQHIAFKDKDGNSRIKRAYVYAGSGSGVEYTTPEEIATLTTDDDNEDHGTHTSSTAGGSSVIVEKKADDNFTVTVTDNHAEATYGGMAPGADLYLAGIKGLRNTELLAAIQKMVNYADEVGKPLVISNSWGGGGARNAKDPFATLIHALFNDEHPNRVILFASANNAGRGNAEGGGFFVKKDEASQANPLGTILRKSSSGNTYGQDDLAEAYSDKTMACELYVLDNNTGAVLMSKTFTANETLTDISTTVGETTTTYYTGDLKVYFSSSYDEHCIALTSKAGLKTTKNNAYTLAFSVFPANAEETADIRMWAGSSSASSDYFSNFLTTEGITWTNGTDDMCVSNQAVIPEVISVGAYVSRFRWYNYEQSRSLRYVVSSQEDDIAHFSGYATAEMSTTGEVYPWITAPGSAVVAGVNKYHTNGSSYFTESKKGILVVNNADNPYAVMKGTSMATPVAAGIVAQWLQAAKEKGISLTGSQVKEIMRLSAINDEYTTTGPNASHSGQGKIDALAGIYAINGGLALADNAINSKKIALAANDAKPYDVTLIDRTLYKDGKWNTICLPFSLSAEQIAASELADATLMVLNSSSSSLDANGTLTLSFTNAESIEAGQPYIIKWTKADNYDEADPDKRDIKNPAFTGVTITSSNPIPADFTDGTFVGQYDPFAITNENISDIIMLSTDNRLGYSQKARTLRSFRCHFEVPGDIDARDFVLDFDSDGQDIVSAIESIESSSLSSQSSNSSKSSLSRTSSAWFTLDGRQLDTMPKQKGIYVFGGRKVVIK